MTDAMIALSQRNRWFRDSTPYNIYLQCIFMSLESLCLRQVPVLRSTCVNSRVLACVSSGVIRCDGHQPALECLLLSKTTIGQGRMLPICVLMLHACGRAQKPSFRHILKRLIRGSWAAEKSKQHARRHD